MPFQDRADAGRQLAQRLECFRGEDVVVYALPRGGVPVAAPIAEMLKAPLDLALVRKVGAPQQPELAMGAIAEGTPPVILRNEDIIALCGVDDARFEKLCARERKELERRRAAYLGERQRADPFGRTAIVVDDGVATGATTRAALRAIRTLQPKRLILAVPVAPSDTLETLRPEVDALLCLESYAAFSAIGAYYRDFRQISDEEVIAILDRFAAPIPARQS